MVGLPVVARAPARRQANGGAGGENLSEPEKHAAYVHERVKSLGRTRPEKEVRIIRRLTITPKGVALLAAIDTWLIHDKVVVDGVERYDASDFLAFFEKFSRDLAEKYGYDSPDEVWKEVAEHGSKDRSQKRKKKVRKKG